MRRNTSDMVNISVRIVTVLSIKIRILRSSEVVIRVSKLPLIWLTGIRVKDRKTEEERDITLDGIFVQIGLMPNSDVVSGQVELSPRKEIIIDTTNRTNVSGVYAAGDVTTVPYKQITIAMGEGAKAALSAFDDRVRGVIQ